jgi:hypothetical protein
MLIPPVKYRGRGIEYNKKRRKQRIRQKPRFSQCVMNSIVGYLFNTCWWHLSAAPPTTTQMGGTYDEKL